MRNTQAKTIKLGNTYAKSLFKHPAFLFQVFCDQKGSYSCPQAMQKTVKHKSVKQYELDNVQVLTMHIGKVPSLHLDSS